MFLNPESNLGRGELFTCEILPHKGLKGMLGTLKCYLYNPVPRTDLRAHLSASSCSSALLCQVDKSEARLCGEFQTIKPF